MFFIGCWREVGLGGGGGGGGTKLGALLQQVFSVLSLYTQDFLHSNPTLALRI